ncbi:hypothetical protein [Paralimibaculum aggregatum]|nr:hypothetical protein [Limibaculum sp. NKW23]
MTTRTFGCALVALALGLAAAPADAALFEGYDIDTSISITETGVLADNDIGFGGFSVIGNDAATGTGYTGDTADLSIFISGIIETGAPLSGDLSVDGAGGNVLTGTLVEVETMLDPSGDDMLGLLFGDLGGPAMAEFGWFAAVTLIGEFGDDPFGDTGFSFAIADIEINSAEIPLPLPAALLLTALAGTALVSRRRAA